MNIIIALIIFSLIILFHELGHYLLAKKNDVYVEEFSLGLGPTIIGKQIGETVYSLKALPFGGACVMRGEEEESDDERAYNQKSVPARFAICFAGPFFNFIMAFVFSVILIALIGADIPVISKIEPDSPMSKTQFQAGESIYSLDGKRIHNFRDVSYYLYFENHGEPIIMKTRTKDGSIKEAKVTPEFSKETGSYRIGVYSSGYVKQGIVGTVRYAFSEVRLQIKLTLLSLKMLITRQIGLNEVSGPIGIVSTIGDTYNEASPYGALVVFESMLSLTILLSANLGVMNLLPIPALDGGRCLLLFIEGIRGKSIGSKKEGALIYISFVLLLILMGVVMLKDIWTLMVR